MILKNKYKEQMSKICVDDEMKKRVMSRLRESHEEQKEKKFIFKGQAIYKYGGLAAACCAFAVTYAITTHFPELMNNEERASKQNNYDVSSVEDIALDTQNENKEEISNSESNIIRDIEKGDNSNRENSDLDISGNEQGATLSRERQLYSDKPLSKDLKDNSNEVEQKNKIDYSELIKDSGRDSVNQEVNSKEDVENSSISIIEEIEEVKQDNYDETESTVNSDMRTASYHDEDSKQREYLFQRGVPDLSDLGFNINYVNQISQNEIEIMYLTDKEMDLWIKICDNEEADNTYKKDNNYILYKKNDKNYYIWSSSSIDSTLVDNIIVRI